MTYQYNNRKIFEHLRKYSSFTIVGKNRFKLKFYCDEKDMKIYCAHTYERVQDTKIYLTNQFFIKLIRNINYT